MSFYRPTLREIYEGMIGDIDARLPGANARYWRSLLAILAVAVSGVAWGLYAFVDWVFKQIFVDTAGRVMLARHGNIWGVSAKVGSYATGPAIFSGENGKPLRKGALLQAGDLQYETTAGAIIKNGKAEAPIVARIIGTDPHLAAGAKLSLVSPELGIDPDAIVGPTGIGGGALAEAPDSWRARILDRIRKPPAGGNDDDYIRWAKEVPGVVQAWTRRGWLGRGTVGVLVRNADAVLLQKVHDHITPLAPVAGSDLFVIAPTVKIVTAKISNLEPDTPAIRLAIHNELVDLVERTVEPGQRVRLSHIREAISTAAGEEDHELLAPVVSWLAAPHEILEFGGVEWI